jgi:hypothetical protein
MGDQEARAALVRTPPACNTESGFDPDRSHHSRRYRIAEGVLVTIVPHSQSNQHSLSQLAAGQIVGKFVNQGERGHDPLSLAPRGESCLRIRSVVEDGRELMIAEAIPPGAQTGRRLRGLNIELHDTTHSHPRAAWVNVDSTRLSQGSGPTPEPLFRLAGLVAAAQDSTPRPGPGGWVTCLSNGCCRVTAEE